MKQIIIKFSLLIASLALIISTGCNPPYSTDAEGMKKLEQDLIKEFGANAYYTYISYLRLNEDDAYGVKVQVSEEKESIQQDEYLFEAGSWVRTGPMTMQLGAETPGFYKFQLGDGVTVAKLGEMIEKSKSDFLGKYSDKTPILTLAVLNTNNTVTDANSKFRYTVILKDKNSEITHSYTYGVDGGLLNSN